MVDGEVQDIQPRVFDLLVFLIQHSDRAVSKAELQDALWPTMEVSETALTRAVMKARKVIGDDGEMIKTIHGHGYHFIEPFTIEQTSQSDQPNITQPKYAVLLLVVLLAVVATAVVISLPEKNQDQLMAVLPVIDDTEETEMSWASLGLMSLALQIIQSDTQMETVSSRTSAKITEEMIGRNIPLTAEQLAEVQEVTAASHHLASRLSKSTDNNYLFEWVVHHPKGQSIKQSNTGSDPTALLEQAVKSVNRQLGGYRQHEQARIVSENTFVNELYARGMSWQIQGHAAKARDYFALVKEEEPTLFWPRYELALTTRKLGQFVQAEEELLALLEEWPQLTDDPKAPIALYNALGLAKQLQNDEPAALVYLEQGFVAAGEARLPDTQALLAGNVALSHKRMGQYDQAKTWLGRAQQIMHEHDLTDKGQITYQLAQLERDTGNNDKALMLFDQAIEKYQKHDLLSHIAAAESSKSRIMARQGRWQPAMQLQQKALQTRKHIELPMGIIDSQISLVEILTSLGQYTAALDLIDDTQQRIMAIDNQSRIRYLERARVMIAWHQDKTQMALDLIQAMSAKGLNRNMKNIRVKSQWLLGDQQPLRDRLAEYESKLAESSQFVQLEYWDLKAFEAIKAEVDEADKYLVQAAKQAHGIGLYAKATQYNLELANRQLDRGEYAAAQATLDGLTFYQLDWWQIDLTKSRLLKAQGQAQAAIDLVSQAKENSHEAWLPQHDKWLTDIQSTD